MKLVGEVGNWKIVAHIAFKFYSVASGTFSTASLDSRMEKSHWLYVLVGLWSVINLGLGWWLFNKSGGYSVALRYPYLVRLQLFVPYAHSWEHRIDVQDREAVRTFRRRLQVWYYGAFLFPLSLLWLAVWMAYR